ncbi:MAG: hypothetical protein HZA89_10305 [Verrucomicrobia bacterium]|nr:hypothetical protein [Verrucomicrobiota bacterium]
MQTTFEIPNTAELDAGLIDKIKAVFPNQSVRVSVSDEAEEDTTEYLLRSPANRERLLRAIDDIKNGRNLVVPDQTLFQ